MKPVYNVRLLKRFGIEAIVLSPFILFSMDAISVSQSLFRHELQHIYQVQRLGWFKLYFSYLKFYVSLRRKGFDHFQAYWNIPYEIEAREAETLPLSKHELALWNRHRVKAQRETV